jgi:hypothetical protein
MSPNPTHDSDDEPRTWFEMERRRLYNPGEPKSGGDGWREPSKVDSWRPPGINVIDALVDAQDMIDRAARIRELGEASRTLRPRASEPDDKKPEDK